MKTGPTYRIAARTSAMAETSSAGEITTKPGREQARAVSSTLIWDGPSSPIEIPLCVPTTFTFSLGYATVTRNCSKPLFITKQEKLATTGILPAYANPAAMAHILASAIPQEKKRSGNSLWKNDVYVDLERSASPTTMSLFSRPATTSALPKASRVAMPSFSSNFGLVGVIAAPAARASLRPALVLSRGTSDYSP